MLSLNLYNKATSYQLYSIQIKKVYHYISSSFFSSSNLVATEMNEIVANRKCIIFTACIIFIAFQWNYMLNAKCDFICVR